MTENIHFSKDLEAQVLGACLMEQTAFGRCYGIVEAQHFYLEDHQKVFSSLLAMYDTFSSIDLISATLFMSANQETLFAGNLGWFLTTLTNKVTSTANLEKHCLILKEMWQKRKLVSLTSSGVTSDNPREQIKLLTDQLLEIQGSDYKQDWFTMDEIMFSLIKHQQDLETGKKQFITTGFKRVDAINGGYAEGNLIVIGARPSVGKSALMGKKAAAMARTGKKVGIISLEMNNTEIAARLASLETDIDFSNIYRNLFKDQQQQEKFYNAVKQSLSKLPIYISDKTRVDLNEIKAKAYKLKKAKGIDCLMLDYLQLVDTSTSTNKQYNREQEVSKISRGLKLLAMELEIPVIILCQLNRASTLRKGGARYPMLSDLRESGAIEQDADVVGLLHRDYLIEGFQTDHNGMSTERQADLLFVKWRNGEQLQIKMDFEPAKMKFTEKALEAKLPAVVFAQVRDFTMQHDDEIPF